MLSCLLVAISIATPANAQERTDTFLCLIQPKMTLKLGTQVPGLIREMLVDRGAVVKKGDVIARLESGVEAAAVLLAEARAANESSVRSGQAKVDYQKRQEERMKALRKNDTVAFSAADEAETLARVPRMSSTKRRSICRWRKPSWCARAKFSINALSAVRSTVW